MENLLLKLINPDKKLSEEEIDGLVDVVLKDEDVRVRMLRRFYEDMKMISNSKEQIKRTFNEFSLDTNENTKIKDHVNLMIKAYRLNLSELKNIKHLDEFQTTEMDDKIFTLMRQIQGYILSAGSMHDLDLEMHIEPDYESIVIYNDCEGTVGIRIMNIDKEIINWILLNHIIYDEDDCDRRYKMLKNLVDFTFISIIRRGIL